MKCLKKLQKRGHESGFPKSAFSLKKIITISLISSCGECKSQSEENSN